MNTVFHRLLAVGTSLCLLLSIGWFAASAVAQPLPAPDDLGTSRTAVRTAYAQDRQNQSRTAASPTAVTPCENGQAGAFPCQNIDLVAQVSLSDLGNDIGPYDNAEGADIWGWTDPQTGVEYAIMLLENGTAFVDLSQPTDPVVTAFMPSESQSSRFGRYWRDAKVHNNHAYVVADGSPNNSHGMQVFDLTRLRTITIPLTIVTPDTHIDTFGAAHNIAINEDSGYAYVVGSNRCNGGLLIFDVKSPNKIAEAGCFNSDGYTHDVQCVNYAGPDNDYLESELCFAANEDTLTVVDVTEKDNPAQVARVGYTSSAYTHQGWLSPDHRYFIMNDEADETSFGINTRTYVWDVQDVDNPVLLGWHNGRTSAIDHNLYIKGNLIYEANYRAGLEILAARDYATVDLETVAYFDVYPASNTPNFNGAWSVYPYFESGLIIVSSIEYGLFVLQPRVNSNPILIPPPAGSAEVDNAVTYEVEVQNLGIETDVYTLTAVSALDWPTSIDPITVSLGAQEATTATVEVTIPTTATVGTTNVTAVTMQSGTDAWLNANVTIETEVLLTPQAGLQLTAPVTVGVDTPGTAVSYTLMLTNTGNTTDTFTLDAASTWLTTIEPMTVTLASETQTNISVNVLIPATAAENDTVTTTITAVSQLDPHFQASVDLVTTAEGVFTPQAGLQLTAPVTMSQALPTTAVSYTLMLTNTGNTTDTIGLSANSDWAYSLEPMTVTLASGAHTDISLTVTVPVSATDGQLANTVITAVSGLDNEVTVSQTLATTAVWYKNHLPLILRLPIP